MMTTAETHVEPTKKNGFTIIFESVRVYTVLMVAQRVITILTLPLYTRYLSRKDYGVLELLDMVPSIIGLIVGMRLSSALNYFYHKAESEEERQCYVSTALVGSMILGMFVGFAGYLCSPFVGQLLFSSHQFDYLVRIVFIGFSATFTLEIGLSYLRVLNVVKEFAAVSLIRLLANLFLNLLFLIVFRMGVSTMLWSSVITSWGLAVYFTFRILKDISIPPSVKIFFRMGKYSIPIAISALGEFILHFGDRFFLRNQISLADLGTYGLAYKLAMTIPFITTPFFTYWNSQMVAVTNQVDGKYIYARMATYLLAVLTVTTLAISVFAKPIVSILAAPEFLRASAFIPWLALAYMVRGMGGYWSNTFLLDRRSGLMAMATWGGCFTCLAGYVLLIPKYGVWGAVASTIIGFSVMSAIAFFKSQLLRPFPYEYGRWAKLVGCGIVAAIPPMMVRTNSFWVEVVLGSLSAILFIGLLLITRFATHGEMATAIRVFSRFGNRFFGRV